MIMNKELEYELEKRSRLELLPMLLLYVFCDGKTYDILITSINWQRRIRFTPHYPYLMLSART